MIREGYIINNKVTYKQLIIFYLPLAFSALAMNLTHFTMSIALNKLPDPDLYISSYNIAKNLALMVQSIGICLTYVVTTFVVNEKTFNKVLKYSIGTIITVAVVILSIGLTPISRIIFSELYNLTGDLLDKAVISLRFIEFFSIAVCIRVFFVGIALKLRYNPLISLSSFLRLSVMIILNISMGVLISKINIDYIPGLMILLCGLTELFVIASAILIFNKDLKQNVVNACKKHNTYSENGSVSYKELLVFALPIILSFALKNLAPSITNSALALTQHAAKVIAAYSIAMIVTYVISSLAMSYQHIIINHDSFDNENKRIIQKFAIYLGGFCCVMLILV